MKHKDNHEDNLVRKQFGAHAEAYATSAVHAKGASLVRLLELVDPQSEWRTLDVATGAGHTALVFAPHVAHVVASDITPEMLGVAEKQAAEKAVTNISFEIADAEELPFADSQFDLVSCRIAPHHFPRVDRFVSEARRVLRRGGVLAVVDNVVPVGRAGEFINQFERLRDPSHHRALAVEEWVDVFTAAGFDVRHAETADKRMAFQPWAERMGASAAIIEELRGMLLSAPEEAEDYFAPGLQGQDLTFRLSEAIIIGQRSPTGAKGEAA